MTSTDKKIKNQEKKNSKGRDDLDRLKTEKKIEARNLKEDIAKKLGKPFAGADKKLSKPVKKTDNKK